MGLLWARPPAAQPNQPVEEELAPAGTAEDALALLHAIADCDEEAVREALAAGSPLEWKGLSALHLAVLCDWPELVPLLVSRGAAVDAPLTMGGSDEAAIARLEGVGVPEQRCSAVLPLRERKTPLALAVRCGAAEAAQRLLEEEASTRGAFEQLTELASQAGKAEVAQQLAHALLAAPLPRGGALARAHTAAARLAFPLWAAGDHFMAFPWLLQELLCRHQASQLGQHTKGSQALAVWAVCDALLARAARQSELGLGSGSRLEAVLVDWLQLPAAGWAARPDLVRTFEQARPLGAVMPALLALPQAQVLLQKEAQRPLALGEAQLVAGNGSLVFMAASTSAAALDAALAAGGAVTLNAVNCAALRACCEGPEGAAALRLLRLLLSRGVPPVPEQGSAPPATDSRLTAQAAQLLQVTVCPIYSVLECYHRGQQELLVDAAEAYDLYEDDEVDPPTAGDVQHLHMRCLEVVDALADAGYRPTTFKSFPRRDLPALRSYYPADDPAVAARWELKSSGRHLWRAALRQPWSRDRHHLFPAKFRAAVRALLLAAHRGGRPAGAAGSSSAGGGAAALLWRLPRELTGMVVAGAAYPLSAWRPTFKGGRVLKALRRLERAHEAYLQEEEEEGGWWF